MAANIFPVKVARLISYCLPGIAPFLTLTSLKATDSVKSKFFKHTQGLSADASAILTLELAGKRALVEELAETGCQFNSAVLDTYEKRCITPASPQ